MNNTAVSLPRPADLAGKKVKTMGPQRWVVRTGVGLLVAVAGTGIFAHHIEVNEFDRRKPVTLTGEVVKLQWLNPHPWIHINVTGDDGQTHEWMIEAAAPINLLRRGFSPDSLRPGTVITVEGYQARDGARRANGKTVIYEDGHQFYIGFLGLLGTGPSAEPTPGRPAR